MKKLLTSLKTHLLKYFKVVYYFKKTTIYKMNYLYVFKDDKIEYCVKEIDDMNTLQIVGDIKSDGLLIDLVFFKNKQDFLTYYNDKNRTVNYYTIKCLIDTGACKTALSDIFIEKLNLEQKGFAKTIGVGTDIINNKKFDCVIYHDIFKHKAISLEILNTTFKEQPYNAILGRDFLQYFTLIYDGWSNSYRLINVNV
jgi:hypothetical protein